MTTSNQSVCQKKAVDSWRAVDSKSGGFWKHIDFFFFLTSEVLTFGSDCIIIDTVFFRSEHWLIIPCKLSFLVKRSTLITLNIDRQISLCREGDFGMTEDQSLYRWIAKAVLCSTGTRLVILIRFAGSCLSVRRLGFPSLQMQRFRESLPFRGGRFGAYLTQLIPQSL